MGCAGFGFACNFQCLPYSVSLFRIRRCGRSLCSVADGAPCTVQRPKAPAGRTEDHATLTGPCRGSVPAPAPACASAVVVRFGLHCSLWRIMENGPMVVNWTCWNMPSGLHDGGERAQQRGGVLMAETWRIHRDRGCLSRLLCFVFFNVNLTTHEASPDHEVAMRNRCM